MGKLTRATFAVVVFVGVVAVVAAALFWSTQDTMAFMDATLIRAETRLAQDPNLSVEFLKRLSGSLIDGQRALIGMYQAVGIAAVIANFLYFLFFGTIFSVVRKDEKGRATGESKT